MNGITDSMMVLSMEEEDADVYSSPYDNYLRLLQTIQTLESGARLTEDWFCEHTEHILKYRSTFPDIRRINEDVEDSEFRKKASEAEVILSSLVSEIKSRGTFTVKTYLLLNKRMKDLSELISDEDDLIEMVGKMGL